MIVRVAEHSPAGAAQAMARPPGVRLAPLWVIVVFSNLPVYIFTFVVPALEPLYWLGALFGLTYLALIRSSPDERNPAPVFEGVLVFYACMCLAWYVGQGGGNPELLRTRLFAIAVCGASYFVFAMNAAALQAARRALVVMVVMAVLVNVYDITHPFALIPADSELSIVGRAAGFFINPNQAGAALVGGFALSVGVVPPRWRSAYLVLVAFGVALTFSRAAILGLVLVSIALALRGRSLSFRQLATAAIMIIAAGWITWLLVAAELESRFHIDPDVALDRLFWVLDPANRGDFSEWERIMLLERGWNQFLASPFLGNGLGSTELWEARASTHNEYVMLASDFGVLGLFVLPAIVLAAIGTRGRWLSDAAVAGLFLLFWGLFSHNVLTEYYLLLTISLTAALSRREAAVVPDAAAPGVLRRDMSGSTGGPNVGQPAAAVIDSEARAKPHGAAKDGARVAQRIVIVVGSLARGGAERVATTMANAWAQQGREVWLVATYLGERTSAYPVHPEVSLVFLSALLGAPSLRGLAAIRKAWALRGLIRRIAPDAVVSFLSNVNVLTLVALSGLGFPVVVSERTDPAVDADLHWLFRFIRGMSYRRADAVVVQTAAAARRWAERLRGVQRIEIIHNPLPRDLDAAQLQARQDVRGGLVIGMGRLGREKGFGSLLEAFAKGLAADPGWTLDIWGEGPLRADLAQRISSLQLEERAHLRGATTQPWSVLAAAQIFVLSSEYEGFPNAMLEAMAVGLPCVAFDCPSGPRQLADHGATAIIVPAGDVQALASTLRDVAADREMRQTLGARAAAYVRREFSEARVMADWDRLLGQLLPARATLAARGAG